MKKFKFRLEPLLNLRAHAEKQKQREHSVAVQQVQNQKGQLAGFDSERHRTVEHQRRSLVGSLSLAELLICSRYLVKLRKNTLSGRELLRGYEKEAEQRRQRLVEASKEKKIYETLKEKQQQRHQKTLEQAERKESDEVATNGFIRRTKGK
jgi:flagellar FliJ protein